MVLAKTSLECMQTFPLIAKYLKKKTFYGLSDIRRVQHLKPAASANEPKSLDDDEVSEKTKKYFEKLLKENNESRDKLKLPDSDFRSALGTLFGIGTF